MCSKVINKSVVLVFLLTVSWDRNSAAEFQEFSGESQLPEKLPGDADAVMENMVNPYMHHPPRPPQHNHPPFQPPPIMHAGLPRRLTADPVALQGADHQLQLNVSWLPPLGPRPHDYSIEVNSLTKSEQCDTPMCYEYDIIGDVIWYLVPSIHNPVSQTCEVRAGCSYRVRLIAHPWDGHTAAETVVQLDECVAGVCSCAHASRLPMPVVMATTVVDKGEVLANVSWSLPPASDPLRLPQGLKKVHYILSIGKQMVSDAHPSPWFANSVSRRLDTDGSVSDGDSARWALVPIVERGDERKRIVLDVRLLARVSVVDDRGCVGPAGNATAYDPAIARKINFGAYAAWAAFGGVCVLAMVVILAMSARAIKRLLHAVRSAPLPASLGPRAHPAWLPLLPMESGTVFKTE